MGFVAICLELGEELIHEMMLLFKSMNRSRMTSNLMAINYTMFGLNLIDLTPRGLAGYAILDHFPH